jgi:hypothetical protein
MKLSAMIMNSQKAVVRFAVLTFVCTASTAAFAGVTVVQGVVTASPADACKSGLGFTESYGQLACLSPKNSKVALNGLEGSSVKFEGQWKKNNKEFVVWVVNPDSAVGSYRETGFLKAIIAATPYVQGAEAGLSGQPFPPSAPVYVPPPPMPTTTYVNEGRFVSGNPGCTRWEYSEHDGAYYVTNSCGETVDVSFTSQTGNMWGEGTVAAGQRQAIGIFGMSGTPSTNGELWLYTCPNNSSAVMSNGNVFWSHTYHGAYTCHKGGS